MVPSSSLSSANSQVNKITNFDANLMDGSWFELPNQNKKISDFNLYNSNSSRFIDKQRKNKYKGANKYLQPSLRSSL
jgi:hypothetical protein